MGRLNDRMERMMRQERAPEMPPDATGIEVTLGDMVHRDRLGGAHKRWVIPLGGGAVQADGITVEVSPQVDMRTDRWRDYDELERLAAQSEQNGGYLRSGDTVHVGQEILVGRDALDLLTHLLRRANERVGDPNKADYERGYRDAIRAARRVAGEALQQLASE